MLVASTAGFTANEFFSADEDDRAAVKVELGT
jgi:hypothetical protein